MDWVSLIVDPGPDVVGLAHVLLMSRFMIELGPFTIRVVSQGRRARGGVRRQAVRGRAAGGGGVRGGRVRRRRRVVGLVALGILRQGAKLTE